MSDIIERWLATLGPKTQSAYRSDLEQWIRAMGMTDMNLRHAHQLHVSGWLDQLKAADLAPSTINRKRASLASFFRYARDVEGWDVDPLANVKGLKVSAFGRAKYPSTAQVQAILEAIPEDTLQGQRDLAVLLGLFVTARRISEWLPLRWRDFYETQDGMAFRYTGKGGLPGRQAIPADLWQVVYAYELAAGRWPLRPNDPMFIAHSENGNRLPNSGDAIPATTPLSAGYIRAVLRRYALRADVPEDLAHPHGLRHAGARWRKENGASPFELQRLLAHRNLSTTLIYTETVLEEPQDAAGDAVVAAVLPRVLRIKR